MNDKLIECTRIALNQIKHPRLFKSERGYAAAFHFNLMMLLLDEGILDDDGDLLLEMEYQKVQRTHGTRQRPDTLLHVPSEITGDPHYLNNYGVWAFKKKANGDAAWGDFNKLNEMFEVFNYPVGFFINIDSEVDHLEEYEGPFKDRLYGAAVKLTDAGLQVAFRSAVL